MWRLEIDFTYAVWAGVFLEISGSSKRHDTKGWATRNIQMVHSMPDEQDLRCTFLTRSLSNPVPS